MKFITKQLIAPCGMNCALCLAYLREEKHCPGCRGSDAGKSFSCAHCRIKNCPKLKKHGWQYCFACDSFPCDRIKHIDKRYRAKYEMSMIDNLGYIKKHGIKKFLLREQKRWVKGDQIYCVHRHTYY